MVPRKLPQLIMEKHMKTVNELEFRVILGLQG